MDRCSYIAPYRFFECFNNGSRRRGRGRMPVALRPQQGKRLGGRGRDEETTRTNPPSIADTVADTTSTQQRVDWNKGMVGRIK